MAYYPFNRNANDASGNGHDGLAYNVTPTEDRFGVPRRAYWFNGIEGDPNVGSAISVTDPLFNIGDDYTISLWFSTDDVNKGNQTLIAHQRAVVITYNHNYAPGYVSYFLGNGFDFWAVQAVHGPKNDYQTGTWYCVIPAKQAEDCSLYINGELDSTLNLSGSSDYNYMTGFQIGGSGGRIREIFKGAIDDIRVYNRALSPTEVTELYKTRK